MRFVLVLASFVAISLATSQENLWEKFKHDFNKSYKNPEEEFQRFQIFKRNLVKIEENKEKFRAGEVSFQLGITKFADVNEEEFFGGNVKSDFVSLKSQRRLGFPGRISDVPERIDWRKIITVPAVQDQGPTCNATHYFAAVGLTEAYGYASGKLSEPLSVQCVIDCTAEEGYSGGCESGHVEASLDWIATYGLPLESSYPYEGIDGKCRKASAGDLIGKGQLSYAMIEDSEEELTKAVATGGLVAVSIDGRDLPLYTGGVLNNPDCSQTLTWQIEQSGLIVGYDVTEDGQEYWLVQFSYGTNWGEDGYARIARNVNMCGITTLAFYASF